MPSTLELCDKYFGTRDVYQLLEITKDSQEKDIKKAYYKLSLKVHPDRVPDEEKEIATEKFKVLAKIHQVLTDKTRKTLYDEKGIIDDDDEEGKLASWLEIWRKIFKPITTEEIDNYQKEYVDSELEKGDIKKAYEYGKGCINYMMNSVPFMAVEDEPRIKIIVQQMIDANEVPEYEIFTKEPASKRNRRHKKYAKEMKQSQKIKEKMDKNGSLEQQIMKRQDERASTADSFFDKLLEKYGNEDDSEEYLFKEVAKKRKQKKSNGQTSSNKKSNQEEKPKERKVKNGRVSKSRRSQ